jgi:hypothetical protein
VSGDDAIARFRAAVADLDGLTPGTVEHDDKMDAFMTAALVSVVESLHSITRILPHVTAFGFPVRRS